MVDFLLIFTEIKVFIQTYMAISALIYSIHTLSGLPRLLHIFDCHKFIKPFYTTRVGYKNKAKYCRKMAKFGRDKATMADGGRGRGKRVGELELVKDWGKAKATA